MTTNLRYSTTVQNEYNRFLVSCYNSNTRSLNPFITSQKERATQRLDAMHIALTALDPHGKNNILQAVCKTLNTFKAMICAGNCDSMELTTCAQQINTLFEKLKLKQKAVEEVVPQEVPYLMFRKLFPTVKQYVVLSYSAAARTLQSKYPDCIDRFKEFIYSVIEGRYGKELKEQIINLEVEKNIIFKLFLYDLMQQETIPSILSEDDLFGKNLAEELVKIKALFIQNAVVKESIIDQILHDTHEKHPGIKELHLLVASLSMLFDARMFTGFVEIIGTCTVPSDEFLFQIGLRAQFAGDDTSVAEIKKLFSSKEHKKLFTNITSFYDIGITEKMMEIFQDEKKMATLWESIKLFCEMASPDEVFVLLGMLNNLCNRFFSSNDIAFVGAKLIRFDGSSIDKVLACIENIDYLSEKQLQKTKRKMAWELHSHSLSVAFAIMNRVTDVEQFAALHEMILYATTDYKEIVQQLDCNPRAKNMYLQYLQSQGFSKIVEQQDDDFIEQTVLGLSLLQSLKEKPFDVILLRLDTIPPTALFTLAKSLPDHMSLELYKETTTFEKWLIFSFHFANTVRGYDRNNQEIERLADDIITKYIRQFLNEFDCEVRDIMLIDKFQELISKNKSSLEKLSVDTLISISIGFYLEAINYLKSYSEISEILCALHNMSFVCAGRAALSNPIFKLACTVWKKILRNILANSRHNRELNTVVTALLNTIIYTSLHPLFLETTVRILEPYILSLREKTRSKTHELQGLYALVIPKKYTKCIDVLLEEGASADDESDNLSKRIVDLTKEDSSLDEYTEMLDWYIESAEDSTSTQLSDFATPTKFIFNSGDFCTVPLEQEYVDTTILLSEDERRDCV